MQSLPVTFPDYTKTTEKPLVITSRTNFRSTSMTAEDAPPVDIVLEHSDYEQNKYIARNTLIHGVCGGIVAMSKHLIPFHIFGHNI